MSFEEKEVDPRELRRLTRRALLWSGAGLAGALIGLDQFNKRAPAQGDSAVKDIFQRIHRFNEGVAGGAFFATTHQDTDFARTKAIEPRNNYHSETPEVDAAAWRLNVDNRQLTLADLKALGSYSQTTELKCVEGWSAIVNWTGCRFVDFMERYPPTAGAGYVALRSEPEGYPDAAYYVGLDIESCRHPQSLLAWEMNGEPLTAAHGAPLRLVMPHKYGIKNIKLITHLAYAAERPADYWAEQGYDWYAGL